MRPRVLWTAILAVAVVLCFGLGPGFADDPSAKTSTKKIAKIAAQVVKQKAPGLSVKAAKTATRAGDADALGGAMPETYLNRVAFSQLNQALVVPSGPATQVLAPVSLTVPPGVDFVHVSGTATAVSTNEFVLWVTADETCNFLGNSYVYGGQYGDATPQDSVTADLVVPTTPGEHVFRLCTAVSTAGSMYTASLTAETVAAGSLTSSRPAQRPGARATDRDGNPMTAG